MLISEICHHHMWQQLATSAFIYILTFNEVRRKDKLRLQNHYCYYNYYSFRGGVSGTANAEEVNKRQTGSVILKNEFGCFLFLHGCSP